MRNAGRIDKGANQVLVAVALALVLATTALADARSHDASGAKCEACHTPTAEQNPSTSAPRWNPLGIARGYQPFAGTGITRPATGDGSSFVCLSCHDNSVGVGHVPGTRVSYLNLEGSHPVGVPYTSPLRRTRLRDAATQPSGLGGTIASDLLVAGRVECVSCHDRHHRGDGTSLRLSNEGSALCLTCHDC